MKVVLQERLTRAATRYGETGQAAAVCCNACRACVQTNLLTLGLAAVLGAGAWLTRRVWPEPKTRTRQTLSHPRPADLAGPEGTPSSAVSLAARQLEAGDDSFVTAG